MRKRRNVVIPLRNKEDDVHGKDGAHGGAKQGFGENMAVDVAKALGVSVVALAFPFHTEQCAKQHDGNKEPENDVSDIFPHAVKREGEHLIKQGGELLVIGEKQYHDGGGDHGYGKPQKHPAERAHQFAAVFLAAAKRKRAENAVQIAPRNHEDRIQGMQKAVVTEDLFARKPAHAVDPIEECKQDKQEQQALQGLVRACNETERQDTGHGGKYDDLRVRRHLGADKVARAKSEQKAGEQYAAQRVLYHGERADEQKADDDRKPCEQRIKTRKRWLWALRRAVRVGISRLMPRIRGIRRLRVVLPVIAVIRREAVRGLIGIRLLILRVERVVLLERTAVLRISFGGRARCVERTHMKFSFRGVKSGSCYR